MNRREFFKAIGLGGLSAAAIAANPVALAAPAPDPTEGPPGPTGPMGDVGPPGEPFDWHSLSHREQHEILQAVARYAIVQPREVG